VGSLIGGPHSTAHLAPPIPHAWRQVVKVDWRGVLVRLAGRTGRESVSAGRCLCGLVQGHVASLWAMAEVVEAQPTPPHQANQVPAGLDFTLLRLRLIGGSARAYRHRKGHDTWHFCPNCSQFARVKCVSISRGVSLRGCAGIPREGPPVQPDC